MNWMPALSYILSCSSLILQTGFRGHLKKKKNAFCWFIIGVETILFICTGSV